MAEPKKPAARRRNAPGQGRPRKPTALKVLDGGKASMSSEPTPDERRVVRPAGMSERGRRVWDRLAPGLIREKVLTFWDVDAFRMYCEAVSRAEQARADVDLHGLTIEGAAGTMITNPAVRIQRDQEMLALRIAARFGLTPSDRAGLPGASKPKTGLGEFTG